MLKSHYQKYNHLIQCVRFMLIERDFELFDFQFQNILSRTGLTCFYPDSILSQYSGPDCFVIMFYCLCVLQFPHVIFENKN